MIRGQNTFASSKFEQKNLLIEVQKIVQNTQIEEKNFLSGFRNKISQKLETSETEEDLNHFKKFSRI